MGLGDVRAKSLAVFQAYEDKPALNGYNSSNRAFGPGEVPIRGTFMKSNASSMAGTWINRRSDKPFFAETMSVFEIGNEKIKKNDALIIAKDTLDRLSVERPAYKTLRKKFDKTMPRDATEKANK